MNFQGVLLFYKAMHQLIVYSSDMNPLDTASTIKGHGVHDDNLIKAYEKLIRTRLNIKREAEEPLWPFTPDEVTEKLNTGQKKSYTTIIPYFPENRSFQPGYWVQDASGISGRCFFLVSIDVCCT